MGRQKRKQMKPRRLSKRKTEADRADQHDLYQKSVQAPEADIEFFTKVFEAQRGRAPLRMREDFCGTAYFSTEWCKSDPKRTAVGVDLSAETLQWGREHNLAEAPDDVRARIELIEGDVRSAHDVAPAELTCAMNFSFCVFKTRAELLEYFRAARAGLVEDGVFFCELYGGMEAIQEVEDHREVEGFTYIWQQARYNPIDHSTLCHIHFEFEDGSEIRKAFTYDWRLWTIPELRELMLEAGFREVRVYWEEVEDEEDSDPNTDELTGTGEYVEVTEVENQESWLVYIAAFV